MRRALPPVAAFAALGSHMAWTVLAAVSSSSCGVVSNTLPEKAALYIMGGSIWMGASYALAAGFFTFSLQRYSRDRRQAAAGAMGGIAVGGAIYAVGCFVLGCCGSPLLPLYLGFLGGKQAGAAGPLLFALTLVSVGVGTTMILRQDRCRCAGRETEKPGGPRDEK